MSHDPQMATSACGGGGRDVAGRVQQSGGRAQGKVERTEDWGCRARLVRDCRRRRQEAWLGRLQEGQAGRPGVHLQPLPGRGGLRGPLGRLAEGLQEEGRAGRRGQREQHSGRPPG